MTDPLIDLFADVLEVEPGDLSDASSPENTPAWTSLAAMRLVSAIEDTYEVELTTREIMTMQSVGDARDVLRSKGIDA